MSPRICDLMTSTITCATADYSIEEANRIMRRYDLRTLPIVEHDGRYIGVVTGEDLAHFLVLAKNMSFRAAIPLPIKSALTIAPDASLRDGIELMVINNSHHLIILNQQTLAGILSASDVMQWLLKDDRFQLP